MSRYKFRTERLAYWYFRLNGFLSTENFIVHDETRDQQRTDIDLMVLRLPHRAEALKDYGDHTEWMEDDPRFAFNVSFAAFVEVTTKQCKINGPWTNRELNNLPRALRALGAVPEASIDEVSNELYEVGQYKSDKVVIGVVTVGATKSHELAVQMPNVMQIQWSEVTQFIFDRFQKYRTIKRQRPQWDLDGHLLWRAFEENAYDATAFAKALVMITETPTGEDIENYCCSQLYGQRRGQSS